MEYGIGFVSIQSSLIDMPGAECEKNCQLNLRAEARTVESELLFKVPMVSCEF